MKPKVLLIHGPNLNMLGDRENALYGNKTSEAVLSDLRQCFQDIEFAYFHSNSEAELIQAVQQAKGSCLGFLINPGGYSHTSVALADAVRAVNMPCICVHISNIYQRETYRHQDLVGEACRGAIVGLGTHGYALAVECLLDMR